MPIMFLSSEDSIFYEDVKMETFDLENFQEKFLKTGWRMQGEIC